MGQFLVAGFTALVIALAGPATLANACACCAASGTWRVSIITAERVVAAIKATRRFDGLAAAGDPGSPFEPEEARRVHLESASATRIVIAGKKGRLVITPSKTAVFREMDITFAAGRAGAGSAKLLKTYGILGRAQLSGEFVDLFEAKQVRVTIAVLGVGNNCPTKHDMKRWQIRLRSGSRTVGHAIFPAPR